MRATLSNKGQKYSREFWSNAHKPQNNFLDSSLGSLSSHFHQEIARDELPGVKVPYKMEALSLNYYFIFYWPSESIFISARCSPTVKAVYWSKLLQTTWLAVILDNNTFLPGIDLRLSVHHKDIFNETLENYNDSRCCLDAPPMVHCSGGDCYWFYWLLRDLQCTLRQLLRGTCVD